MTVVVRAWAGKRPAVVMMVRGWGWGMEGVGEEGVQRVLWRVRRTGEVMGMVALWLRLRLVLRLVLRLRLVHSASVSGSR